MTYIDKKLTTILQERELAIKNEVGEQYGDTYTLPDDLTQDAAIDQIKQAFIDAGWFQPADADLVQQLVNMRAQQRADEFRYGSDLVPLIPRYTSEQLKAISEELSRPRMTGQAWYVKFEKELASSDCKGICSGKSYCTNMVDSAAKKAAGVE